MFSLSVTLIAIEILAFLCIRLNVNLKVFVIRETKIELALQNFMFFKATAHNLGPFFKRKITEKHCCLCKQCYRNNLLVSILFMQEHNNNVGNRHFIAHRNEFLFIVCFLCFLIAPILFVVDG